MSKTETVEEFLARGGEIKKLKDPMEYPKHAYAMKLLSAARSRASSARRQHVTLGYKEVKRQGLGVKCDLSYRWIRDKIDNGFCEVTGIPFNYDYHNENEKLKFTNPWAPSIDRINSLGGYTKDNCQMVVWIYNRAKGEDKHEDVLKVAEALIEKKNEKKRS